VCGAGVAMALSDDATTWSEFLSRYARKTAELLNLANAEY